MRPSAPRRRGRRQMPSNRDTLTFPFPGSAPTERGRATERGGPNLLGRCEASPNSPEAEPRPTRIRLAAVRRRRASIFAGVSRGVASAARSIENATICAAPRRSGRPEAPHIAAPEAESAVWSGADGRYPAHTLGSLRTRGRKAGRAQSPAATAASGGVTEPWFR